MTGFSEWRTPKDHNECADVLDAGGEVCTTLADGRPFNPTQYTVSEFRRGFPATLNYRVRDLLPAVSVPPFEGAHPSPFTDGLWIARICDLPVGWEMRNVIIQDFFTPSILTSESIVECRPVAPKTERVRAMDALRTKRCAVWPGQDEIERIVSIEATATGLVVRSTYMTEPHLGYECPVDDDGMVECWVVES
ncbi:MAG: hypothetical protein ABIP03_06045 [Aquihabitans sp.]